MMYSFLFEGDTPEANYYRWRTYGIKCIQYLFVAFLLTFVVFIVVAFWLHMVCVFFCFGI